MLNECTNVFYHENATYFKLAYGCKIKTIEYVNFSSCTSLTPLRIPPYLILF